jgi:hypothetical protein
LRASRGAIEKFADKVKSLSPRSSKASNARRSASSAGATAARSSVGAGGRKVRTWKENDRTKIEADIIIVRLRQLL